MRQVRLRAPIPLLLALLCAAPAACAQYTTYPSAKTLAAAEPDYIGTRLVDFSVFGGYQLNGDVGTTGGSLTIGDAVDYGVAVDYRVSEVGAVELMWQYSKPSAVFFSGIYPSSAQPFNISSNYFQIGGTTGRRIGRLEPFLGLTIGAVVFSPEQIVFKGGGSVNPEDTWRFAATLFLGTKVWLTNNIGVRLEVRMLMPKVFQSGGFYFRTRGGRRGRRR